MRPGKEKETAGSTEQVGYVMASDMLKQFHSFYERTWGARQAEGDDRWHGAAGLPLRFVFELFADSLCLSRRAGGGRQGE